MRALWHNQFWGKSITVAMVKKKPYKIKDIGLRVMNFGMPSSLGRVNLPIKNHTVSKIGP